MKMTINSQISLAEAQIELARRFKADKYIVCSIEKQQRSLTQNKAMHLYFKMLAFELTAAGLDIKKTLKKDFDISWNEHSIKVLIWKPVQEAMFGTDSTTKLTREKVSQVYDIVHRHILNLTNGEVNVQFPSKDQL